MDNPSDDLKLAQEAAAQSLENLKVVTRRQSCYEVEAGKVILVINPFTFGINLD